MGVLHPALLLLLAPAGWLWWRYRGGHPVTAGLRLLAGLLLVVALAAPYLKTHGTGRDLVIVVDRSRSMPAEAEATAAELIALAEAERREGDRVAVVAFGARAAIERLPSEQGTFDGFSRDVLLDGSDLGEALETAIELIPEGRPGNVLLLSDGEGNGTDPLPAARRAFARGIGVHVRPIARPPVADLAVERIELPQEVDVGEPFQFSVWVRSDRRVQADLALERAGEPLTSGLRTFEPGLNRVVFRDVVDRAGVASYAASLSGDRDRVPENDRGIGAVRVRGTRRVLVVNHDGAEDTLVRTLRAARLPVDVASPETAPLDRISLTAYRAVVLENAAAHRMRGGLEGVHDFVTERGGGLLVTGGRASFGIGGYFLSPVDEILPVSMEMRQEHRKQGVAMAIVLDRSGSMGASVAGGMTKMDLANQGSARAIELLSPIDAISVIAVDSSYHIIQDLVPVEDPGPIISRAVRISAGGGGIFVYTGLLAAGKQLENARQKNKHIILFSDAADSEEQEGVPELLEQFELMGITVSVIALGTAADVDARFLEEVAYLGNGEVYFTTDPNTLPALFAQDTMTAARSTFVEEPTGTHVLPDLFGMGEIPASTFPTLSGYNLTYLREGAMAGVVTTDDYDAPIFAFSYEGLGRSAAFTGEIGGEYGQEIVGWEGFAPFFVTVARWLVGQEEPEELFPRVRREGSQAVISVEVDPSSPTPPDTSHLEARLTGPDGEVTELVLERTGEHEFSARTPLSTGGISLGTVRLGDDRFVALPPVALPYSPEFERSADAERGPRLMRTLARESGGDLDAAVSALFEGAREGRAWRVVSRELLIVALILLLVEIAGRRLQLWGSLGVPRSLRGAAGRLATGVREMASRPERSKPRSKASEAQVPDAPEPTGAEPEPTPEPEPKAPAAAEETGVTGALARARREADRKLGK